MLVADLSLCLCVTIVIFATVLLLSSVLLHGDSSILDDDACFLFDSFFASLTLFTKFMQLEGGTMYNMLLQFFITISFSSIVPSLECLCLCNYKIGIHNYYISPPLVAGLLLICHF